MLVHGYVSIAQTLYVTKGPAHLIDIIFWRLLDNYDLLAIFPFFSKGYSSPDAQNFFFCSCSGVVLKYRCIVPGNLLLEFGVGVFHEFLLLVGSELVS